MLQVSQETGLILHYEGNYISKSTLETLQVGMSKVCCSETNQNWQSSQRVPDGGPGARHSCDCALLGIREDLVSPPVNPEGINGKLSNVFSK